MTTKNTALETANLILWNCNFSSSPVRALSRACSKVGYLARTNGRSVLHYFEGALNEQKHACMYALGDERAREHYNARDRYMAQFASALQRAA